jgi:hypothetical protein
MDSSKKLDAAIENAYQQVNNDGIIVLIVQFDDFTHKYIEQYTLEITKWLKINKSEHQVCVITPGITDPLIEHNIDLHLHGYHQ